MNTALTTNTPEAIGSYFSLYRELLTAQHYVCKNTGDLLPLTLEKKVVWCWMIDRFMFFKNQNKSFFDNQADIAAACGVSESTVKRFLLELTDAIDEKTGKPKGAGYIHTTCTRSIGGHKSNSYTLLSDLVLVQPEKAPKKPAQAKTQQTNSIAAPAQQNAVEELIEPCSDNHISAGESFATEYIPFADEPDWVVATLQDDGSTADALAYADGAAIVNKITIKNNDQPKDTPTPVQKKESEFNSFFSKELPEKRFNSNGMPSTEMLSFCKQNNIKVKEANGSTVFFINGKDFTISRDGFIPYVAPSVVTNDADFWLSINEPF